MIFISHRGNINGNNSSENNPDYIRDTIGKGFDVEVDIWFKNEQLFLGHDYPQYLIDINFLKNDNLWCHAKNLQALEFMLRKNIHCFWHQEDDYTLTSRGYIWTYPDKPVCKNSIIVCKNLKETQSYANIDIVGICSDYVGALI
jgi:hypothetical protein